MERLKRSQSAAGLTGEFELHTTDLVWERTAADWKLMLMEKENEERDHHHSGHRAEKKMEIGAV